MCKALLYCVLWHPNLDLTDLARPCMLSVQYKSQRLRLCSTPLLSAKAADTVTSLCQSQGARGGRIPSGK